MAVVTNPYSTYNSAKVNTVNKGDLLIMLYDAAIRFLREADINMSEKKFMEKGKSLENFQAIVSELEATLNYNVNKQLAENLGNIYNYVLREVAVANFQNDSKKLNNVIGIMNQLRSGWQEANLLQKKR